MAAHDHHDTPDEAEQLRQDHLRSLGMMLVGVAHELNTPLGVVVSTHDSLRRCRGRLAELADRDSLDAAGMQELRSILQHIDASEPVVLAGLERMQGLVRELRLSGRADADAGATRHEPASLVALLEGNLTLLHFELKRGVVVERHYESEPRVMAHPVYLAQVFLNLLRNALQAMAGQGTMVLTVREQDGQAVVEVADTGPGLSDEVLAHLFKDDFTTKCAEEGTGIGLRISHRILEKHGGQIAAANRPEGGAVFTVTLPLV
jgi:signal transduction histidine kinase